ncbi:MAG: hypothetical protein DA408_17735 [Bacteroidetes bacterium]|nr:MAG: hypothetical protein C7N36_14985 [Bacteroidota bacterium]PTM09704.1 MAG: hypothetical protein DA408_17735 [Bacteroidota bacterium]
MYESVHLLTQTTNYRETLPEVLRLLCERLNAGRAILLETTPTKATNTQLYFQRMLEVPVQGEPVEHNIPRLLLRKKFPQSDLKKWLNDLVTVSKKIAASPTAPETDQGIWAIAGEADAARKLKSDRVSSTIIKLLGVSFSSFVFFPLVQKETLWGMLFFSSQQTKPWDPQAVMLARTNALVITNFFARQYQSNQELLHREFLIHGQKPAEKTNPPTTLPSQDNEAVGPPANVVTEQPLNHLITSTIPDFIFLVDIELGKAIYSNTDIFLGYNIAEADDPLDIFTGKIHPDDQAEAIGEFLFKLRDAQDGEVVQSDYRMRHQDGHWVWISERVKVFQRFPDGMVRQYLSTMQDVTEKKMTSLKIIESEQRYRNFLSYSSEGIYYINCGEAIPIKLPAAQQVALYVRNAFFQECNWALAQMYDFASAADILGVKVSQLEKRPYYATSPAAFQDLINQQYKVEGIETQVQAADGSTRYFLNQAVGIIEGNHLVGVWGVQRDITPKRKAQQALYESELRLSAIIQDTQLGIWEWLPATKKIQVNDICLALLGLKGQDLVLDETQFIELVDPEDLPILREAIDFHLNQATENYQVDIRMGIAEGERIWVQLHGRLVEKDDQGEPKRFSGTLLDIHQLKIAELLLAEGEALLKAVLNGMPDTKLRINSTGTILAVYAASYQDTGLPFSLPEVLGKKLAEVLPVFVAKGLLFNAQKALSTQTLQTFEFLNTHNDKLHFFEARVSTVNEAETLIILRDITPLKMAEKALTEQVYKYDQKNRQLEKYIESNLQLENFAYIASHDLREPIRTMRTFGQFLKKRIGSQLDKDSSSHLEFIISSANRMNQLIEDLLTYSRVNTDPMIREAINTVSFLDNIVANLQSTKAEANARIIIKNMPSSIYGSVVRIQQVFQNLIINAIKFRRPGVPPEIIIESKETASHWQFSIADNGIGIEEEFHEQIFVIFKKLHNHEVYQGTGIGLALVKRIIAQHGGEIWLESSLNKGTTFHFTLLK